MERRTAGPLENPDRALAVEGVALAGIGIGDHRDIGRIDDLLQPRADLAEAEEAEIGDACAARDGAAAGVHHVEAGGLHEPRREAVIDARRQDHVVAFDRSEEHTSELQSLMRISYAVFCLKKKKKNKHNHSDETIDKIKEHHTTQHT